MLSTIGSYLGLLLLALYIIALCITNVFMYYIVGRLVYHKLFKASDNALIDGLVGMIVLLVLSFIPYLNTFISFVSLFIGLGAIVYLVIPLKKQK